MKSYFIIGAISLLTLNLAQAQEYIQCKLKISDNRIDCPFFSKCHHKPLKSSSTTLDLELFDGDQKTGSIKLKKVLIEPGTEDEKDNEIVVFKDDNRPETIMKNPESKMITYDIQNGIRYKAQKYGDTIDINFKTSVYNMDISLTGDAQYSTMLPTQDNMVNVSCEKISKAIYQDRKAKETAVKEYQQKIKQSKAKAE